MSARIVMVDDEEALVWTTQQRLERERPDLRFEGFVSPREAIDRLRAAPPDVLVTDLRMPGMSGFELLLEARRVAPQLPVIVVSAYGSPEIRADLRARSGVEFLEKPFRFDALVDAIDRLRSRKGGFEGAISLPMLPDLIQIYTLSLASGALSIERAGDRGEIWFERGQIVHALCGDLSGEPAFFELLGWQGGRFSLDPKATPPARTIAAGWQELLMEGCRILDERQRDAGAAAPAVPHFPPFSRAEVLARCGDLSEERIAALPRTTATLTLDLPAGAVAPLREGASADAAWLPAVVALADMAGRIAGRASRPLQIELVGELWATSVWWDQEGIAAVVVGGAFDSKTEMARFRSGVARVAGSTVAAPQPQ